MQEGLSSAHHLSEQSGWCHVETLNADVFPLQTFEGCHSVYDLLRKLVKPVAVLLLSPEFPETLRRLPAFFQIRCSGTKQLLRIWSTNVPPQV